MRVVVVVQDERDVPPGTEWLAPDEPLAAGPRATAKRVSELRLRRWTAKHALAARLGLPGDAAALARIRIDHEPGGAPVPLVDGRPPGLTVSITDRAGRAACAIGPEGVRLGCDLELVEPRSGEFVLQYLTPAEQALLRAPGADPRLVANLVWCAKESTVKALRAGLDRDAREIEVTLADTAPEEGWRPLATAAREGRLQGWWRRDGDLLLTVVADRPFAPPR